MAKGRVFVLLWLWLEKGYPTFPKEKSTKTLKPVVPIAFDPPYVFFLLKLGRQLDCTGASTPPEVVLWVVF